MLALRPPQLTGDSNDYLQHLVYRPPLTTLLYDVARLFGPLQLRAAVAMQMIIGVVAAFRLSHAMVRAAAVEAAVVRIALFYVLFAPQVQHGAYIMSESLAYSMLSLAVASGLDCVGAPAARSLLACTGWTIAAIATRSQLLFLTPVLLVGTALFVWRAPDRRRAMRPAALAIALIAASSLIQPTYNLVFNRRFVSLQAGGIHLFGVVLFVTEPPDLDVLPDGPERSFAVTVFGKARDARLLRYQAPQFMPEGHHFDRSFDAITWTTIGQSYCDLVLHRPVGAASDRIVRAMSPDEFRAFDRFTRDIAVRLLARSWPRYLAHIATCARQFAGVAIAIAVAMLAAAWLGRRSRPTRAALLMITAGLWLADLVVIGLVQDFRFRYTFPFDIMLIAAALLCAWSFVRPGEKSDAF